MTGVEVLLRLSELPSDSIVMLMGDEDRPVALVRGETALLEAVGDELVPVELPEGFEPTLALTTEREWYVAVWNERARRASRSRRRTR